jgi:hypothetical protein
MKKLIFFPLLATLCLSSCWTPYQTTYSTPASPDLSISGSYDIVLNEVERPENTKERYGESTIITLEEEGTTKYSYEDELIRIVWLPGSTKFSFLLENKSTHSIRIIWDEAVYVDKDGSSGRVMHSGVKYSERNNSQPPTVIVKNSNITDIIVPSDYVYYDRYWTTNDLFPTYAASKEKLEEMNQKYIGKTVKILLPLQIQDTVNEYLFSFIIQDFIAK